MYKLLIYTIMFIITIWSLDSINITNKFKKNRIYQARALMLLISISISYLASQFVIELFNSINLIGG